MTTAERTKSRTVGRTRWAIAGVLGVGSFVNYVDRVNLSIAGPEMMREFHLSAAQLGVVASAFLWTYAVLQLPIGAIIDRIGVRWVNRAAAVLWAIASFLTASAGGLGLLLVLAAGARLRRGAHHPGGLEGDRAVVPAVRTRPRHRDLRRLRQDLQRPRHPGDGVPRDGVQLARGVRLHRRPERRLPRSCGGCCT